MANEQFLTYHRFNDRHDAAELADLLRSNNVDYRLEDHSSTFDASFANGELSKEYRVKLKKEDFATAHALQLDIASRLVAGVGKDHYLFGFSDEELTEVVVKRDEWSNLDFLLAQQILKDRGKALSQEAIDALSRERIEALAACRHISTVVRVIASIPGFAGGRGGRRDFVPPGACAGSALLPSPAMAH